MNARPWTSPRGGGFTLIELLVTITIGAILLTIGVPSFVAMLRNSELTSTANSLVAAMNAARGEAMKRGMSAMVVPATGSDWSTGWIVFVDADRDRLYTEGPDVTILKQGPLKSYFTASGLTSAGTAASYVMFDPSGYSKSTGSAGFQSLTLSIKRNDLSGTEQAAQTRLLIVAVTGRVRACNPSADTTCVTTATE